MSEPLESPKSGKSLPATSLATKEGENASATDRAADVNLRKIMWSREYPSQYFETTIRPAFLPLRRR